MSLSLPPLNALRAFEAAARSGSYVAAAEELGVSPAAVSQQVKNLEEFLGKELFRRYNNRIVLTDAGQTIYSGASDALQSISAFTEQVVSGRARSRLVISALPSVAERWMEPKLAAFMREKPNFRFELRVEEDIVDFARHEIDLRFSYGVSLYPELMTIPILQDQVLPMCSPAYLARNPGAAADFLAHVPDDDLIHTNWGPTFVSHPTWQAWFGLIGIHRPDETRGFRIGKSSLALDLARDGFGVALGQRMMAADDLEAGRLIILDDRPIPLGQHYCLVYPRSKAKKAGLIDLVDWLVQSVNSQGK
jgi:LysR family transcriptional regulator, glycine cleavage system transcriptional activator